MARSAIVGVLVLAMLAMVRGQESPVAQRWAIAFDFVESFSEARVQGSPSTTVRQDSCGGVTRSCIFQHPPLEAGAPPAQLVFDKVPLPTLQPGEKLRLRLFLGLSDRISRSDAPSADGCEFIVRLDGREILRQAWNEQRWLEWTADLSQRAGQTVRFAFEVGARDDSVADWALWGDPVIEIVGRPWKPREGPRSPLLRLDRLVAQPIASRTFRHVTTAQGTAVTAVMDPYLDLPHQLAEWSRRAGPPKVPLAPVIVAGEGPDPMNHTLVRVLGQHGIADVQFLAFPPEIRGGVRVSVGRTASGSARIVAAPLADRKARSVLLFDLNGIPCGEIRPPAIVQPPYSVEAGDYLTDRPGDEIAVIGGGHGVLYHMSGKVLLSFRLGKALAAPVTVARAPSERGDGLVVYASGSDHASLYRFSSTGPSIVREMQVEPPDGVVAADGVYPSALAGRYYVVGSHSERSPVRILEDKQSRTADAGRYENLFWYQWYRPLGEGKYIRRSDYAHLRTDHATPAVRSPSLAARSENWSPKAIVERYGSRGGFAGYLTDRPKLWEPCFTHRQPKGVFEEWLKAKDATTGLPVYPMLTRNGRPVEYGEFGNIDFYASTYAFGLPALDNIYILPLRAFLRELVVPFRRNPEHCAGVEPNHEHEIAVEADGSMGDYNLQMVRGFHDYLRRMYGVTSSDLNAVMGTSFGEYFDAPRNWGRGTWDAYKPENRFYRSWTDYNRYVVSRRVAETFREALLAGFPPEIIKCHQIPDTYAVGKLQAFSEITARFTPIDWMLNAGTGFGFTRYGVWYNQPHDALQDAHTSGFDAISIGEYQALTPDSRTAYEQLHFLFENGCVSAHCMLWPAEFDRGYNDSMHRALERLVGEDRPRPGLTGGVGQIRPVVLRGRRYDVACIGTGPDHTGLLKSLTEDGSWEGTVYAVPFHAHVGVTMVRTVPQAILTPGKGIVLGPFDDLDSGEQIEILFAARTTGRGTRDSLRFTVLRDGRPLPGLSHEVQIGTGPRPVRYSLRNQLPMTGVTIRMEASGSSLSVSSLHVYRETECTTKLTKGCFGGTRHRGAVVFDVLRTDYTPTKLR